MVKHKNNNPAVGNHESKVRRSRGRRKWEITCIYISLFLWAPACPHPLLNLLVASLYDPGM